MLFVIPVILSGGSGSRLWPLSRERHPKQFLPLSEKGKSLFQSTVLRLSGAAGVAPPIIVCNADHRFFVDEQLREIKIKPQSIVLEPHGRSTAPAVAAAALLAPQPESLLLILPADHVVGDVPAFHMALNSATAAAREGALVAFGIVPDRAETGYGYIRPTCSFIGQPVPIAEFVEKPDTVRVHQLMESGEYLWNSGMYLFRADCILKELAERSPSILPAVQAAVRQARHDGQFLYLDPEAFSHAPHISIEYSIMEHTERAMIMPVAVEWSDVGSWETIAKIQAASDNGNYTIGDVLTEDVSNSYIRAESRLVAALGISDQVVVETADAVLVADRSRAQEVRKLVAKLKASNRRESLSHRRVHSAWGWQERMSEGPLFKVRHICIIPGARLPLRPEHTRAEHWIVVRGTAEVERAGEVQRLAENESIYIPEGVARRLRNPGLISLDLIEVQMSGMFSEDSDSTEGKVTKEDKKTA